MAKPTSKRFITVDYEKALELRVCLRECLPPDHLARFVVDIVALLDLKCIYLHYGERGGKTYAPEILLGLLFYGYATGVFSSRKIENKTIESIPFRYIAGGMHIDHDTVADFRKAFLPEIADLFVQIVLLAQAAGVLKMGNISLDGTKIHADASKSKAVSYKRLGELQERLHQEMEELLALAEQADQIELPEGMVIEDEITFRKDRLANLAEAKAVLEARAQERYEAEQAEYQAKMRDREEEAKRTGRKPRGRAPQPPVPGAHDKDQYNFTDPESRIMKNSTDGGFNQHYNVQVAVDQDSFLILSQTLSNHPNDYGEAIPTLDAIPTKLDKPEAAALDNGYLSESNITEMEIRGIDPYIATGREPHHRNWKTYFTEQPAPPPQDASPTAKMAYKLRTEIGKAIYRLRKCTVEPVIGIIKEALGFRQFSLRGMTAAAGEWCLVCLAFNLKRFHNLLLAC
jgi:transposase